MKNYALVAQGGKQGLYQKSSCINGKNSWISSLYALWYVSQYQYWIIGNIDDIGENYGYIYQYQGDLNCPYNIPNHNWKYFNGQIWIVPEDVSDISIRCFQGYSLAILF